MNLDALGMVPMPEWSGELRSLFWKLRAARPNSRPAPWTLQRRIRAEKLRLVESGVPMIEVHHVCRILRCDRGQHVRQWNAERRYVAYLAAKQRGTLLW